MSSFDDQDKQSHIRNFAIIAHIDHGKSTLADRLLELTGTVTKRDMQEQILDSNPIERERGITIKLAPVRMEWEALRLDTRNWKLDREVGRLKLESQTSNFKPQNPTSSLKRPTSTCILNLIDTPGHVDFGYEVSRSLAACEGALLVVDATQGVQAQTLANLAAAREHKLTVIPIINKIDLSNARIEETLRELSGLGFREEEVIKISAKTGENVERVLEAIVERIPAPSGNPEAPLRALVFSSQYDAHKGVVVFVRVVDGLIYPLKGDTFKGYGLRFMVSGAEVMPIEIGYFSPKMIASDPPAGGLRTGEVGYVATGLKDIRMAKVGDTITFGDVSTYQRINVSMQNADTLTHRHIDTVIPLPGYREPKPMVFVGLFPLASNEFTNAREAMERLRLSDSAFSFRPISSAALGHGFHCGFLGLLHAEIVQERLVREFGITMIATAPSVEYHIKLKNLRLDNRISKLDVEAKRLKVENPLSSFQPQDLASSFQRPASNGLSIQSASEFPDPSLVEQVREPVMSVTIFSPKRYVGAIMQLCQEKRGDFVDLRYQHGSHPVSGQGPTLSVAVFEYLIPLSEMIVDFFDRLKSITEGYASLDYEFFDYQAVDVAKVDILVNKEKVDALSFLVVKEAARHRSIAIVERLATVIPRHQFSIPIQAAIGGDIIARADVKPFRKDVIQKLYGGDRTRKDKLLDAQKRGKEKMKSVGRVQIPQSAFFEVLKR